MKIFIPNNFFAERRYSIEILLKEFLGLKYSIHFHDFNFYKIILSNGSSMIIEDHFFSEHDEKKGFLDKKFIPVTTKLVKLDIYSEKIIFLYGREYFKLSENEIQIGFDIIASTFFMLTRWEEYVVRSRNQHNIFPDNESTAFKNNFIDIPVVDIYIEFLWSCFLKLGIEQDRKKTEFKLIQTHDVDDIRFWNSTTKFPKLVIGDLVFRKRVDILKYHILSFIRTTISAKHDPSNTFDYLMDIADYNNSKAYFFILPYGETVYDKRYKFNKYLHGIVNNIKNRQHNIGIHPSYNSYNKIVLLKREITDLSVFSNTKIEFGRQHYLRFEVPKTWQIWDELDMKWDSTLGYSELVGFRCGTSHEFPVFDFLNRKQLSLYEYPLICMDVALKRQFSGDYHQMLSEAIKLKRTVKKYNGNFVFLWHNSNLNGYEWRSYKSLFEKLASKDIS